MDHIRWLCSADESVCDGYELNFRFSRFAPGKIPRKTGTIPLKKPEKCPEKRERFLTDLSRFLIEN